MLRAIVITAILFCTISLFQPVFASPWKTSGCTRASLQTAVDGYLEAQRSGDLSRALLSGEVKYLENTAELKIEEGLWSTPLDIAFHRSFLDVAACRTFTEVIVTEGETQYVIGTRLGVEDGGIFEVDSLVTRKDDWLFNADNT